MKELPFNKRDLQQNRGGVAIWHNRVEGKQMTKRRGLKDNKQQRRHFDVSIVQIKIYRV